MLFRNAILALTGLIVSASASRCRPQPSSCVAVATNPASAAICSIYVQMLGGGPTTCTHVTYVPGPTSTKTRTIIDRTRTVTTKFGTTTIYVTRSSSTTTVFTTITNTIPGTSVVTVTDTVTSAPVRTLIVTSTIVVTSSTVPVLEPTYSTADASSSSTTTEVSALRKRQGDSDFSMPSDCACFKTETFTDIRTARHHPVAHITTTSTSVITFTRTKNARITSVVAQVTVTRRKTATKVVMSTTTVTQSGAVTKTLATSTVTDVVRESSTTTQTILPSYKSAFPLEQDA